MSHRSAKRAHQRTRLLSAGMLSVILMASPLSVTSASAADVSLSVLLDGISLNVSQRDALDRQYRVYREQRQSAERHHDDKALAKARQDYLSKVDRILGSEQSGRFHRQFDSHYPSKSQASSKSHAADKPHTSSKSNSPDKSGSHHRDR